MAKRYIKLYEQITGWEWFRHPPTLSLFIYLLCKANYCDRDFHGRMIHRGQLVTSLPKLATGTGLSIQQTRTALSHLISTGEVTDESSSQDRIITVVKYDDYQMSTGKSTDNQQTIQQANQQTNFPKSTDESTDDEISKIVVALSTRKTEIATSTDDSTDDQQTGQQTNQQTSQHHNKNIYKYKELIKEIPLTRYKEKFVPPTVDEVREYCESRNNGIDPEMFVDFYESKGWMIGQNRMKDWKAAVRTWERDRKKCTAKQNATDVHGYGQRDYSGEQKKALDRMMSEEW